MDPIFQTIPFELLQHIFQYHSFYGTKNAPYQLVFDTSTGTFVYRKKVRNILDSPKWLTSLHTVFQTRWAFRSTLVFIHTNPIRETALAPGAESATTPGKILPGFARVIDYQCNPENDTTFQHVFQVYYEYDHDGVPEYAKTFVIESETSPYCFSPCRFVNSVCYRRTDDADYAYREFPTRIFTHVSLVRYMQDIRHIVLDH